MALFRMNFSIALILSLGLLSGCGRPNSPTGAVVGLTPTKGVSQTNPLGHTTKQTSPTVMVNKTDKFVEVQYPDLRSDSLSSGRKDDTQRHRLGQIDVPVGWQVRVSASGRTALKVVKYLGPTIGFEGISTGDRGRSSQLPSYQDVFEARQVGQFAIVDMSRGKTLELLDTITVKSGIAVPSYKKL